MITKVNILRKRNVILVATAVVMLTAVIGILTYINNSQNKSKAIENDNIKKLGTLRSTPVDVDKHLKPEDANKYSSAMKELKKVGTKISETKIMGLSLLITDDNISLIIDKEQCKDEKLYSDLNEAIQQLDSMKNTTSKGLDINQLKKISDKFTDSKINVYIALMAQKKGFLDVSYDNIKIAISKDPQNDQYKEYFKKIYNERAKAISMAADNVKNGK